MLPALPNTLNEEKCIKIYVWWEYYHIVIPEGEMAGNALYAM